MTKIIQGDIHNDVEAMQLLQRECPLIFDLLHSLKYIPHTHLSPILNEMVQKALAPFSSDEQSLTASVPACNPENELKTLSFFPQLPKLRYRGSYVADQDTKNNPVCTKRSTRHPTLLPGIFTLFCAHGETT